MKNNTRGFGSSEVFLGIAIVLILIVIGFFSTYTWQTVEGNEIGVKETWSGGVDPNPMPPKTYWLNRWTEHIFTYPTSGQVFVMNDKAEQEEPFARGRRFDSMAVNSSDMQQMKFHIILQWRISPAHVVNLHKNYRDHIEERLIRPEVVKFMVKRATMIPAAQLYAGQDFNQLRDSVEKDLVDPNGPLTSNGVLVSSFVIERPTFVNEEYVKKIEARQVAIITESMAQEQKKANQALAEAARAAAQKEANERIVKAEADKQVNILAQEATAQQAIIQVKADAQNNVTRQEAESKKVVLAAQAERDRQVAVSDGNRQAEINRAAAIKAVGEAEANRNQLLLTSFSVPGSDLYVRVKVAEAMGNAFSGIKGYLPERMTYNLLAGEYLKGLGVLMGQQPATDATATPATTGGTYGH